MGWDTGARGAIGAVALGLLAAGLAFAQPEARPDPWRGMPEESVRALLGQPAKAKSGADGGKTLHYKLLLLADDATPSAEMTVLALPGIGVVGLPHGDPQPLPVDATTIAPIETDSAGRPAAGGPTDTATVEQSWNVKTRETSVRTTGDPVRPAIRGKIRLTIDVGPDGTVRDWSVSEKR